MKKDRICSEEHRKYLLGQRRRTAFVWAMRIAILLLFFALWELFAATGVIDSFISSSPCASRAPSGSFGRKTIC